MSMGGSILMKINDCLYKKTPDFDEYKLKKTFNIIQQLIFENKILSLHDRSDGGLITTLIEMSLSGNIGFNINLDLIINFYKKEDTSFYTEELLNKNEFIYSYLFNEGLGIVIELDSLNAEHIMTKLKDNNITAFKLGNTTCELENKIVFDNKVLMDSQLHILSSFWEYPYYNFETLQSNPKLSLDEYNYYISPE